MVPWADPVKRGVASPEMMVEQGQRDELMQNAEFRKINAREQKLVNLANLLRNLQSSGHPESEATHSFVVRHLKKLNQIQEKGGDLSDQIRSKIKKDYPPETWTPQIDEKLNTKSMNDIYPTAHGKWGKLANLDEDDRIKNVATKKKIDENIAKIIDQDFETIGYPKETLERANMASREMTGEDRLGPWQWGKMNELVTRKKPEHIYHKTTQEKLAKISESGLVPPNNLSFGEINWPQFPEQQDKVFFGSAKDTGVGMNIPGTHTTLRTKHTPDVNPDIHAPRGWEWWQTRKPVPPTALEIEASPGVWEPLIEYMKKRGGK
jgi:hypothetical protein